MNLNGRSWAALGLVAGVVAGGSAAVAASSGGGAVIRACYSKRTGALRVASKCRRGERSISWNQVGRRGATGARGRSGVNGINGTNGINGAPGSARAYAYVNGSVSTPTFDAARTKGFSAVSEPQHGVYCLTAPGLDPAKTAPIVSVVYNAGFAGIPTSATFDPDGGAPCAAGQFEVLTRSTAIPAMQTQPVETNTPNLPFTIAIP